MRYRVIAMSLPHLNDLNRHLAQFLLTQRIESRLEIRKELKFKTETRWQHYEKQTGRASFS